MAIKKTTARRRAAKQTPPTSPSPPPPEPPEEKEAETVEREEEEEEEEEEEGDAEDDEATVGKKRKAKGKGPAAKKKKAKVGKSAHLTKDQELEMSEWIGDHPLLYDRSMVEYYKSIAHQDRLWFEKAMQMGILEEDSPFISSKMNPLYKRFLNVHTRLKCHQPSGSSGR